MSQLNESQLFQLIQSVKIDDPVIKDLLREMVKRFQVVFAELYEPLSAEPEQTDTVSDTEVPDVQTFSYQLVPLGIKLSWERPDPIAVLFEIRKGSVWESSSRVLVTSTLSAVIDGESIGTHRYLIKGVALDGSYSTNALALDVVIPPIGTMTLNGSIIDNFVLLNWVTPSSAFRLDYYIITRDGIEVGRQTGTFHTVFENTGGTYQYGVQAVDIFGNTSDVATKDITLAQPADYVLEALETSSLTGTRTNLILNSDIPSLIAVVDESETWADYAANGYASFQDEIDDGYPFYLQPTLTNGEYVEVFDYGSVFDSVIATIDWNYIQHVPTVQVDCYLSHSIDGVTYSTEVNNTNVYAPSLRYLKLRLVFTALN